MATKNLLLENNAIAKIDLSSKKVITIFPLGFKDYSVPENFIDVSNVNNLYVPGSWPIKGMYQPDAIAVMVDKGLPYLFTANEGDIREYAAFSEVERVSALKLDAAAFPNGDSLKLTAQLGRLNVTKTLGDEGKDNDFESLYSFGARSFTVWNGNTGSLIFDSKNELEKKAAAALFYDDGRSDDKGVEPEGLTLGVIGKKTLAFIGMERADAVAVYDVTNPAYPVFLQLLKTGDAPEGVLFIAAKDSPTQQSLLIVSSEDDGVIKIYMPEKL